MPEKIELVGATKLKRKKTNLIHRNLNYINEVKEVQ